MPLLCPSLVDTNKRVQKDDYFFKSGDPPDSLVVGDYNRDEVVEPGDVVFLINYLYKDGPPPGSP